MGLDAAPQRLSWNTSAIPSFVCQGTTENAFHWVFIFPNHCRLLQKKLIRFAFTWMNIESVKDERPLSFVSLKPLFSGAPV